MVKARQKREEGGKKGGQGGAELMRKRVAGGRWPKIASQEGGGKLNALARNQ